MPVLLAAVKISVVFFQFNGSYAIVSSHLFTTAWPSPPPKKKQRDVTLTVFFVLTV